MLCAISGEAPQQPVASRKSGNVYEKRLIEQYIKENGTDPVNGEELTTDDLLDLQQPRVVRPRPPTQTSIPALLATFQNEWDAVILETYQLRQQLSETRQELSTALYYNDAAEKVIVRLQKERDAARDALSRVTIAPATNGANGEAMQVDGQPLPEAVVERIEQTQQRLSSTRRKRPVPEDWATPETVQGFEETLAGEAVAPGGHFLAMDDTSDLVLLGSADSSAIVFSLSENKVTHTLQCGGGSVLDGLWWGNRAVVALSTGAVKVFEGEHEIATLSKHAGAATTVRLHPCGDVLASIGVDRSFVLYDLQTLTPLTQQYTDKDLSSAAFHPDGHLLALGTSSGDIKLFDVKTLENIHTFSSSVSAPVTALSFSENGTWLATISEGQSTVTIWDLRKTAQLKAIDLGVPLTSVSWDYTGQFLAACGPSCVAVQHYAKSSKAWSEPFRKATTAQDLGWGANGQKLVTVSGDGSVVVFSAAS
ncbi:cell cycle control protein [Myriangium duriaei CBS 260.36]|uniref:Pre-mRNA-processing factor 19 n=1 Tax=Myriangium duriaei CBS 260.36 TaxID=1168546 RepID=A0A9P4JBP2_9PEZI|nr:cell cycle control protein [Myriangium duriaei CBS 260.36]